MSRATETEDEIKMILRFSENAFVTRPLWDFPPSVRPAVLRERNRRGLNSDPEPIGDPEVS